MLNSHILIFVTSEVRNDDLVTTTTRKTPNLLKITTSEPKFLPNHVCTAAKHPFYNRFFYTKWDIYHAVVYGAAPFVLILVSNVLIVMRLVRYRHHRMIKSSAPPNVSNLVEAAPHSSDRFRSAQITVMLLTVATLFLLFTGPISVYMTFFFHTLTSVREAKRSFIRTILTHIAYSNNAVNFYAYLCLSSEFRREWLALMSRMFYCCRWMSPKNVTSACTTTTTTLGSSDRLDETKRPLPPPSSRRPSNGYQLFYLKNMTKSQIYF